MERLIIVRKRYASVEKTDPCGQELNALPVFCLNIMIMIPISANSAQKANILKGRSGNVFLKAE